MHARDTGKTPDSATRAPAPVRPTGPVAGQAGPGAVSAHSLLALQRTAGNAAAVRSLQRAQQTQGQEQHQHAPGCGHDAVQRSAVPDVLSSGGKSMDEPVRHEMEARLGADFSDVRLHTGSAARASASEIGARAYTSGNHVVLGDGGSDKHTLAHELTHVIQQRQGPVAGTDNGSGLKVSDPSDRFEREAEANATRAMAAPVQRATGPAGPTRHRPTAHPGTVQRAEGPSKQGEHIFNALDALAEKIHTELLSRIKEQAGHLKGQGKGNVSATQMERAKKRIPEAIKRLEFLKETATSAGKTRNHERFRTATRGADRDESGSDPNARIYSEFSLRVMNTIKQCGRRDWDQQELPQLNAYRNDLDSQIIDGTARDHARNEDLPRDARGKFDEWYDQTQSQMHTLYRAIVDTAAYVDATLRLTRRGALGYPDRGKAGGEEISDSERSDA